MKDQVTNIERIISIVGVLFIKENMSRLLEEEQDWMPCGFEINFPALLEKAKDLDLDIPYDHPVLEEIYAKRNLKLSKYVYLATCM